MVKDLLVLGSGNPDIVRLIEEINSDTKLYNFMGFLEKDESLHNTEKYGYPILGDDNLIYQEKMKNVLLINNVYSSQDVRQRTYNQICKLPREKFTNLIHPNVKLHKNIMGVGNIIYDFVVMQTKTVIGDHNIIHTSSIIGHETILGNNNHLAGSVTIGSRANVGDYCFFGIGSILLSTLSIADYIFIGAGAVIINNVKQKCTLFGNPARVLPQIK